MTRLFEKIVLPEGVDQSLFYTNPETGLPYQVNEVIVNPLTDKVAQELLGERVFWAALIMGILGFLAFLVMLKFITIRVDESSVKTTEQGEKINIFSAFGKFVKNRPAVGVTLAAMGMFLGMNAATTATTIMFATYFGMAELSGVVQMVGFLPSMLFIPFIKKIVVRFGKKEASVFGAIISLVGAVIMMLFPMVPYEAALPVYMISLVIYGVGMGFYTCVSWAMMGDAIDYNEWKYGTREEGTVYALHSFFRKLAQGIGPAVALLIMQGMGYRNNAVNAQGEPCIDVTLLSWDFAVELRTLVAILFLVAAVMQFIGLGLVYNLDKKTLAKMNDELTARHAVEESVEAVDTNA